MRKRDELTKGCMAKAGDDEMTFVLLGRDPAAPFAIQAWVMQRVRLGKNKVDDPQILEARECASVMETELAEKTENDTPVLDRILNRLKSIEDRLEALESD